MIGDVQRFGQRISQPIEAHPAHDFTVVLVPTLTIGRASGQMAVDETHGGVIDRQAKTHSTFVPLTKEEQPIKLDVASYAVI